MKKIKLKGNMPLLMMKTPNGSINSNSVSVTQNMQ